MRPEYFVFKQDGTLGWIEKMPKKNEWYKKALKSAINNAIEVSNMDDVLDVAFASDNLLQNDEYGRKEWKVNSVYPLNCRVEITEECRLVNMGPNATLKKKARVTFEQPEKRNPYPYKIGDKVMYPSDNCPFIVTGVRPNEVRIYGDFSGGVSYLRQEDWVHINDVTRAEPEAAGQEQEEIERYRINAEEDYKNTPISVLRYISELENITRKKP